MIVLVVLLGMWVLVASMRAGRAERECDELRATFLRCWGESVKAEERLTREQHRADAAEARATALRQAMQDGRGALRKLLRHHRDKHHDGTQPYDQEVATGLWHMEIALADEALTQQRTPAGDLSLSS